MKLKGKKLISTYQEFLRYFFWGLIATGINLGLYELLILTVPIHYLVINGIVWVVTVLFGYYTNRRFVFKTPRKQLKETIYEASHFVGFRLVSGFFDTFTMWLLLTIFGINALWAKLAANLVASLINYVTSKQIVFKRGKRTTEEIQHDLEQENNLPTPDLTNQ